MVQTLQHLPRDVQVDVGTDSVVLSPELTNQMRHAIIITNISTGGQTITIGIGKEAVANRGIILFPGAVYHETIDPKFRPTNAQICAISSLAGGSVAVHERIAQEI